TGDGAGDHAEHRGIGQAGSLGVVVGGGATKFDAVGDLDAGAVGVGGEDIPVRGAAEVRGQVGEQGGGGGIAGPVAVPDVVDVRASRHHRPSVILDSGLGDELAGRPGL